MSKFGKFTAIALIGASVSVMAADSMQDHMKDMEQQMSAIMNEKDPAKRHELMEKHMSAMHDNMMTMKKSMDAGDKGMAGRMKTMEERMDKMEKEMHGGMTGKSAPAKAQDAKPAEHDHQH